jgi:hypothetical protein
MCNNNVRKSKIKLKNKNTTNAKRAQLRERKIIKKDETHVFLIIFPLSLTLNNTSASLVDNYYLGTLKWNAMKTKWEIYEKNCLVFQKKNLVFMIGFHS